MFNVFTSNSLQVEKLPLNSNLINISLFNDLTTQINFRSFSLKYVGEGTEVWNVNNQSYRVEANQLLMANQHADGRVSIDSPSIVRGVCIDVSPQLISQAAASLLRPDTDCPDISLDHFFQMKEFPEKKFEGKKCATLNILKRLDQQICDAHMQSFFPTEELYFELAAAIVNDYDGVFHYFKRIPAVKADTRKFLYQRLEMARTFMEEHYLSIQRIAVIAEQCGISEYHFYRLFKSTYGLSPYQFLQVLKMRHAAALIQKKRMLNTEVAFELGYESLSAFKKAYTKYLSLKLPSELDRMV
jgi:AraC family transcriptional regulator